MRLHRIMIAIICAFCGSVTSHLNAGDQERLRDHSWDLNIDPHRVVGSENCTKCHSQEMLVWKQTPHFTTFSTLHRKQAARDIASRLGIASFKTDSNCIQCHYTMQSKSDGTIEAIAGVSCESCHGGARDWIAVHNDYGGEGVRREQETYEHRIQRLTASIQNGMRNPINAYLVAQSCYRCHTVPDERLVNVGGHVAGSLDFELVSWSQGSLRHKFIESDGRINAGSPPERLRLLFISGLIADLEFSLRATARATTKDTFVVTSASRANKAWKRLQAVQEKLQVPVLDEIIRSVSPGDLKLNNRESLEVIADLVHQLGLRFAATTDGAAINAIDPFIPTPDRWK